MNKFDDELKAVAKIYEILSPFGMGGATRIWNYLSLRLQDETIEKERNTIENFKGGRGGGNIGGGNIIKEL